MYDQISYLLKYLHVSTKFIEISKETDLRYKKKTDFRSSVCLFLSNRVGTVKRISIKIFALYKNK